MEKEFIPYEQALELKELGFDSNHYILSIDTPDGRESTKVGQYPILYQQAFRWGREKYNLFGFVLSIGERNYEWRIQNIKYLQDRRYFTLVDIGGGEYDNTYEEAELECLKKLIEIVKEK